LPSPTPSEHHRAPRRGWTLRPRSDKVGHVERPDREGPTWFLRHIGESAERRAARLERDGEHVGARDLYASALAHQLEIGRRGEASLRAVARLRAKLGDPSGARADYLRVIAQTAPEDVPDLALELLVLVEPSLARDALQTYPVDAASPAYERYLTATDQLARVDPAAALAVHESHVARLRSLPPGDLVPVPGRTGSPFAQLAEETRRAKRAADAASDPDAAIRHELALEELRQRAAAHGGPSRPRPRIWTLKELADEHGRNGGLADAVEDACTRLGNLPAAVLRMQAALLAAATADDALQESYRAQARQLRDVVEREALEYHRTLGLVHDPEAPEDMSAAARQLAGRDYFHGIVYGLRRAPWFSGAAIAGLVEDGEALLTSGTLDRDGCTQRLTTWTNDLRRLLVSMARANQPDAHLRAAHLRVEAALLSDARPTTDDEVQAFEGYVDDHLRRFGIEPTLAAIAPGRAMRSMDSGPWPEARWMLLRGEVCERHARTSPDEAGPALQRALADFARAATTATGTRTRARLRRCLDDQAYRPVVADALGTVAGELEDALPPGSALEASGRTHVLSAYRLALDTVAPDDRWHHPEDIARTIVRTADAGCMDDEGHQVPDYGLDAALAALGAGDHEIANLLARRYSTLMIAAHVDPRHRRAMAPQADAIVRAFQLAAGIMSGTIADPSDGATALDRSLRAIDSTPGAARIARSAIATSIELAPDLEALASSTVPHEPEQGSRRLVGLDIFDDDDVALDGPGGLELDDAIEPEVDPAQSDPDTDLGDDFDLT